MAERKKILIIDDEEHFCFTLKRLLEMRNFLVFTATQGKEGIRLARLHKPDVILLDIVMPDLAGTHVAEQLAEDPLTSKIPIIFVTAIVKPEEIKKREGIIGGRLFVAKPVLVDELVEKINSLF